MIRKKKIVFKVPEFPHLSETFIIAQVITAIKLGYKVKIVTRKRIENTGLISPIIFEYNLLDNIIIEDYKIPKNKLLRLFNWSLILLKNSHHLKSIINYHKEFTKFSLTCLYQWCFYFQFNDASIFHVQYGTNSNPLPSLKKAGFKPSLIVTFHGHDAFFPINGIICNNGYYDSLFKYGDVITANTPYLGEKLLELGCPIDKLVLIPVGVDTNFFTPPEVKCKIQKHLRLITVGRLDKVKGQNFCIEVVRILVIRGFELSLSIIGFGIEQKSLLALITKYRLENHVFLKGGKSQEEIREELQQHDIYLLLGQATSFGARESQGLATLEAQACGLPVIVFDSGGIKYTVEDGSTGFICEEFDVNTVAKKIIKFIEQPELIEKMGNQAVAYVNQYYSQLVIDRKWEVIYNSLSNESK